MLLLLYIYILFLLCNYNDKDEKLVRYFNFVIVFVNCEICTAQNKILCLIIVIRIKVSKIIFVIVNQIFYNY